MLIVAALLPANYVSLAPLILLWTIAGCGQSLINLSIAHLLLAPDRFAHTHAEVRHTHDLHEQLEPVAGADEPHCHPGLSHRHPYTDISHEHHAL